METMLALDVSYLGDERAIEQVEWAEAKRRGFDLAIVGSHHGRTRNPTAETSLRNARLAGLYTATYIAIDAPEGAREDIALGIRACGAEWPALSFCAVDVELDGLTVAHIRDAVDRVARAGGRPVIYSGAWYWRGRLGDPADFKHLPLWNAHYDGRPVLDFKHPYGGWTSVVGKQYLGTHDFGRMHPDANIFDAAWVRAGVRNRTSPPLTAKDAADLWLAVAPGMPAVVRPNHIAVERRPLEGNKRVYTVRIG